MITYHLPFFACRHLPDSPLLTAPLPLPALLSLQAHSELMNLAGQGLDERGRRSWEGHSRTDIRSMRNHFRKLPFHLARDRGATSLAQLVDPRIPIDAALDTARCVKPEERGEQLLVRGGWATGCAG